MNDLQNLLLNLSETGILTVTINRPEKLNALNVDTIAELGKMIDYANEEPSVKGVIIIGSGEKAFVAGADITEIAELSQNEAKEFSKRGNRVFSNIEKSSVPVIAVINGFALGGGCELAMACHIRIASANAKFGQPEVNLGLIPGYGGTQRLPKIVGRGKALELMLTADLIDAQEALRLGLVNHVYNSVSEAMDAAVAMMKKINSKAPIAVANVIDAVDAGFQKDRNGLLAEASLFGHCVSTEDFTEGTKAFIEKRPANFKGE
jgi:enoyl-CoA hydratase